MKNLFHAILILCTLLLTYNCEAGLWIPTNLNIGNAYNVYNFNGNIFVSGYTGYGLYKTSNFGFSWTQTSFNPQIGVGCINSIGNRLFISGGDSGVYFTTNNGNNWIKTSFNGGSVRALSVNGNTLYAGTNQSGIFISTNNGDNWVQTTINYPFFITGFAFQGNIIYMSANQQIYSSSNNGYNWSLLHSFDVFVNAIAILGNTLFAGTSFYGIYKSTDNGLNWIHTSVYNSHVVNFLIYDCKIFSSGDFDLNGWSSVFLSYDTGNVWYGKGQGLGNNTVYSLAIDEYYIYAAAGWNPSVYRRDLWEITDINKLTKINSDKFSLSQNYPNPFNPSTNIKYQLANTKYVTLKIFDILGKEIATLVNEKQSPGTYEVSWEGSAYPSGVYFYKLISGDFTETKKMLMIK
jgi:hypothetical protein